MLEKPDLPETLIASQVKQVYGLAVNLVTFLPLGYDINTAVYRVVAQDGRNYFLKLRKGVFNPVTVDLPKYLNHAGISAIIAPLETQDGRLSGCMDSYTIILYPFLPGRNGYEVRLTDVQWIQLGRTLRRVHDAQLPIELRRHIPHETYDPQWRNSTRGFLDQAENAIFQDALASHLAAFMQEKRQVIGNMLQRADELAQRLQKQPMEFVLCHNDAHPGNYHITETGDLYLVDWDTPIYAPRERDLMCFGGGMSGDQPGGRDEQLFHQGYGSIRVNQSALAYFRYERVIQDIAEFCKQILWSDSNSNNEDRLQSFQYLVSSFQPGSVLEAAIHTDITDGTIA
ncbi:MAG TPA: aminoglycoside phosphotransferase family protein [Anaerolineales bacterium]|nr:aminoglycoside phosphotransferase family protein [Anaerolineales bacterium]